MSVNDKAIETVAIHMAGESRKPDNFYEYPYNDSDRARHREKARAALEAALPHIRKQIAEEIEADVIRKAKAQAWGEGITSRIRELETTNAHQAKVIEYYTARSESLKETLAMIADRVDDFVYDELSSDIEDVALNELGETYESDKKRLETTIQRVRDARSNHPEIPECDRYTDDDTIKCGWKSAVESIDKALEES